MLDEDDPLLPMSIHGILKEKLLPCICKTQNLYTTNSESNRYSTISDTTTTREKENRQSADTTIPQLSLLIYATLKQPGEG